MSPKVYREAGSPQRRRWAFVVGLIVVGGLLALAAALSLPVREHLDGFILWVHGFDEWAGVVYGAAYAVATVCFVPGTPLTLLGGFAFGLFWGVIIVWAASTVSAALSFLIGRFVARDWVAERVCKYPRFNALFRAIDKEGFKVVFLARLVPVFPFGVLNYGFSITGVSFGKYLFASSLGILLPSVVYVYLGTIAGSLARIATGEVESTPLQDSLFWIGGVAAVGIVWLLTRRARQELEQLTEEAEDETENAPIEASVTPTTEVDVAE
ncbi:MAG: TVP38/TMEM64 family protein [Persicimonas sp.]